MSVYINEDGNITYFKNPKRKPNLRGTKFSIPKPVGGRMNKDLILREDELMTGEKKHMMKRLLREQQEMEKQISDTLEGNYWQGGAGYGGSVSNLLYENGAKGGLTQSKGNADPLKIGYGRKNPNIPKRKA